jgi:uncharacterized protein
LGKKPDLKSALPKASFMHKTPREFQVFAKPAGAACNLACRYCYYLEKEHLFPQTSSLKMGDELLEDYMLQVIRASDDPEIRFSWHGGEPTLLGIPYFEHIAVLQKKHLPRDRRVANNLQTNGILLDEAWGDFLARENFTVGLSMDGPAAFHDANRVTTAGSPSHERVLRAWRLLSQRGITTDILCTVHTANVFHPLDTYGYFKSIGARYIGFLPIVEKDPESKTGVSTRSVPARAFGEFLCAVFDQWKKEDIGKIIVQIFEEVTRTALGQEHSLCIFRKTCGQFPVVEHNGDFFSCDHFVDQEHRLGNIRQTPLVDLLESRFQLAFGQSKRRTLAVRCRTCSVLRFCNGGCPKDRFVASGDGKPPINYLCEGYKRFFTHCQSFVQALSREYRRRFQGEGLDGSIPPREKKPGRNEPCSCGSGKKYKVCCLKK